MLLILFLLSVQLCSCSSRIEHLNVYLNGTHDQQKLFSLSFPSFEDYSCSNTSPNDQSCHQLAKEGVCDLLESQFCALSCQTCCVDISPTGISCEDVNGLQNGCDYFVELGYCLRSCNACHKLTEIFALSSLQTSINSPDQLSTWTGWDPCNNWDGVICQNNRISELRLGGQYFDFEAQVWYVVTSVISNVATTIPVQLSCLEDLVGLWMGAVGFSGTLPPEFSALIALKGIDFDEQPLAGYLPAQYSTCDQLIVFDAGYNSFTSSIPPQFSTWTDLNQIYVHQNQLSGVVPFQFSTWRIISTFYVYSNKLTGSVPVQLSTWINIYDFGVCDGDGNDICVPDDFYGSARMVWNCPKC